MRLLTSVLVDYLMAVYAVITTCAPCQFIYVLLLTSGSSEVIGDGEPLGGPLAEPAVIERVRPSLDAMIQRLQLEQDHRIALEGGEPLASPPPVGSPPPFVSPRSTRNNQGESH